MAIAVQNDSLSIVVLARYRQACGRVWEVDYRPQNKRCVVDGQFGEMPGLQLLDGFGSESGGLGDCAC